MPRGVVVGSLGLAAATLFFLWQRRLRRKVLVLFDVDGTLAVPAQKAPDEILAMLADLRERSYLVGIVGAGDFEKQQGQLGGPDLRQRLDFCFSENGVHAFRGETLLHRKSIVEHVGAELWKQFEAQLDLLLLGLRDEAKRVLRKACPNRSIDERGTFLERRMCTVNICPIGRTPTLSKAERASFDAADRDAGLRARLLDELVRQFGPNTPYGLVFSIGGQIGIDVNPVGWDKTFCLRFLPANQFPTIHFFGDKTEKGGGDYELYSHPRVIGHSVTSVEHTLKEVKRLLS
jgi:phosphomannomutase